MLARAKTVQVDPTVVPEAGKVKEEHAANQVADSLRNVLKDASFEIAEAPFLPTLCWMSSHRAVRKRFIFGFGAGRSTVDCRLVIQDSEGKELVSRRIRVRGNLVFSPYQGNNTQRRQAVSSFEPRLPDEIEKLKYVSRPKPVPST